ncbi:MAG TPA: SCP2 sterol-binding domain-containing protein [Jatrophihabitantaceae bacterium]|nr:SCP2 sterol-binding domain-containing protein [Jatrophihabitantaceae bacterium]
MATVAQCEQAFHDLAARLAAADSSARKKAAFDRTLSCTLDDLDVTFAGRLKDGQLTDIRRVDTAGGDESRSAQVRMTMSSDDLLTMVAGKLNMGTAWATGRVKIDASVLDLMRLRAVF